MDLELKERVYIVTGASRGLGRAVPARPSWPTVHGCCSVP